MLVLLGHVLLSEEQDPMSLSRKNKQMTPVVAKAFKLTKLFSTPLGLGAPWK